MDRIEEIKKHEAIADKDDHFTSSHRWQAAKLVWEEIEAGKSRHELGREIGKSHTHVRYMYNCWDIVGRKLIVSTAYIDLPNFNPVYLSEEVRGNTDQDPKYKAPKPRGRPSKESTQRTSHDLVIQAADAIDSLTRNTAFHPLITDDDIIRLRKLPAEIRILLRKLGR